MATLGLVGGLGPEATIDYYRRILEEWQRYEADSAPSLLIDSVDYRRLMHFLNNDRAGLVEYLLASLRRLAGAGVDFAAISANTPHIVFDELAGRSPVPLLSIVETCAAEAARVGLKRLGLLGTRFTMEASFYPDVFARHGAVVVAPNAEERVWAHERYVGELLVGDFRDTTRSGFGHIVRRLRDEEGIDGLILGGTELPLLMRGDDLEGLPVLDTTSLHVSAIVKRLR